MFEYILYLYNVHCTFYTTEIVLILQKYLTTKDNYYVKKIIYNLI